MYADLILYTEPRRPLVNPKFDLFAFLNTQQEDPLFKFNVIPARVVDHISLMLPEKCRRMERFPDDTWEFIVWQVEEKGYAVVRSIDQNWLYWSILADKFSLLNMVRILV